MEELLAQQRLLKHSIEKSIDNVKKLGKANVTLAIINSRFKNLRDDYERFRTFHATLLAKATKDLLSSHKYFVDDHMGACEDAFITTSDFLTEWQLRLDPSACGGVEAANVSHNSSNTVPQRASVHLPRLNLPKFSGELAEWESFRDQFTSLIAENEDVLNVNRLHYLKSCLKGEPFDLIRNITLTDANFKFAWNLLLSRYDNERRLVHEHLHALHTLTPVTNENASALSTLRDRTHIAIESLRNLERPVESWDDIIVYLLTQKFDRATRKAWELHLGDAKEYPTFKQIDNFLASRIRALENLQPTASSVKFSKGQSAVQSHLTNTRQSVCVMCRGSHPLFACPDFQNKAALVRKETVKRLRCCFNCLSPKHRQSECTSKHSCKICQKKHHSLLHISSEDENNNVDSNLKSESTVAMSATTNSHLMSRAQFSKSHILLATAWITVSSREGRRINARALIDQGSITTVISEKLAKSLKLSRQRVSVQINGIGDTASSTRWAADISISPRSGSNQTLKVNALILSKLTSYVPSSTANIRSLPHVRRLKLADPNPASSDAIDVIIGADLYGSILQPGLRTRSSCEPVAQKTIFGWLLSGTAFSRGADSHSDVVSLHHCALMDNLSDQLKSFWEVEEIPKKSMLTPDETRCEEYFRDTHSRTEEGRYMVRLPFKSDPPLDLGDSKATALAMYRRSELRLASQPDSAREYDDFLREYEALNHMVRATSSTGSNSQVVYIPHHAVIRKDSTTTHLRVVFNASSRTTNGRFLNDHLLIGPKLQTDLPSILTKWCHWKYAYTADVAKMFRQILVDPRDTDYQRILWRSDSDSSIEEFKLLTVTYGTASAPYLALRVMQQLAEDEGDAYPLAKPVISQHTYVDDCVFGSDDIQRALQIRDQLISLLKRGGFQLHKWACNHPSLRSGIISDSASPAADKIFRSDESFKVLGIRWSPSTDTFNFNVQMQSVSQFTKRNVLSMIARLFDPLGWLAPVIIHAKMFMQKLWLSKCEWDTPLSDQLMVEWQTFYTQLSKLNLISVPRWIGLGSEILSAELHGFSDASTAAYGAAVYLKCTMSDGSVHISLIGAKSRVAPLKQITIPRLELCAAVLLSQLIAFVRPLLGNQIGAIYCWTDSTVTLAWISQPFSKWKLFVANRVQEVQTLVPHALWNYVSSNDNPADLASRGLLPSRLNEKLIWWEGPSWLRLTSEKWPKPPPPPPTSVSIEEKKMVPVHVAHVEDKWDLSARYSSWSKLIRITAYIYRFVRTSRKSKGLSNENPSPELISSLHLDPDELRRAKVFWLKDIQGQLFSKELVHLASSGLVKRSSPLSNLNPYLDELGLIRVRGRLRHSLLDEKAKHPIVLAAHPLVELLIRETHLNAQHAGPKLTLALLREELWILRARQTLRAVLYKCIPCTRESAHLATQLMGDLPDYRVRPVPRTFTHCGIDYAGPIAVRSTPGRGFKSRKTYIAVFVCMTVKAVHLELVSDCTTSAFLAAFSRFCARRGVPETVYSDNATNFQGAKAELEVTWHSAKFAPAVLTTLAEKGTTWRFIPPSAPHFGGLWEACVKSVKHHLKRVVGDHTLTVEEMMTLLCKIEACLNSRPIGSLSDSLDDYSALTPGHFLVGTPLLATPEPSLLEERETRLSRWQLICQIRDGFWKSWSADYLHTLQQRPKWRDIREHARKGRLVLLKNPLAPPSQWELGRITECHPGADNLTRVVTVQTARTSYKRPVTKLCFLPIDLNGSMEGTPA